MACSSHDFYSQIHDKKWDKGKPLACSVEPLNSHLHIKRPVSTKQNAKYIPAPVRIPLKELSCYDPITQQCHGISQSQWLENSLSCAAFNDSLEPFSISTVCDLRRLLPPEKSNDPTLQSYISSVNVIAHPKLDMTLDELSKEMRINFRKSMESKSYFGHIKSVWELILRTNQCLGSEWRFLQLDKSIFISQLRTHGLFCTLRTSTKFLELPF